MKEKLTNQPPTPYPRSGGIFMSETGGEFINREQVVTSATRKNTERRAGKNAARAWIEHYHSLGKDINNLPGDERNVVGQLMREGVPPVTGGATPIPDIYTDETLKVVIEEYNAASDRAGTDKLNPHFLDKQIDRVHKLIDEGRVNRTEAAKLIKFLDKIFDEENPPRDREGGTYFKLTDRDKKILDRENVEEGVIKWINDKFDTLYEVAKDKDPESSPYLREISDAYAEAIRHLTGQTQKIHILSELFETRENLMFMNSSVSTRDMENVTKAAGRLTARGLLTGLSFEKRKVSSMVNRMDELLEDMRLKAKRGHVTSEMIKDLQRTLLNEEMELAKKGVSAYGDLSDIADDADNIENINKKREELGEEKLNEAEKRVSNVWLNIRRTARTASDLFVCSQRLSVIAARGKHLLGLEAFFSDPGVTFKAFNPDAMALEKWSQANIPGEKMHREVKNSLVNEYILKRRKKEKDYDLKPEERIMLGDLLFKDLAAPADLYSSGWRIMGILDQMQDYFEHRGVENKRGVALTESEKEKIKEEKSEEFGLFMRLKLASSDVKKREPIWKKIIEYRPEEIMRLLQDKLSEKEISEINKDVFAPHGVSNYVEFKEKFGSVVRSARELGFRAEENPDDLKQTNFADLSSLTAKQRAILDSSGNATQIEKIYKAMQNYIKSNNIIGEVIEKDWRFVDIYTRTIAVDDALLSRLENPEYGDMMKLSKRWSPEIGGDALVRNMRDIAAANAGADAYVGFLKAPDEKEKLKSAQEFAQRTADYNGREAEAMILRHTFITYLQLSKIPALLDLIGIKTLPFEIPTSEIQRIYGYHMKPLDQEERRVMFLQLENMLQGALKNRLEEIDTDITLSEAEKEEKRKEAMEGAKEAYHQSEKTLGVTMPDMWRQKGAGILLVLLLGLALEVAISAKNASGLKT